MKKWSDEVEDARSLVEEIVKRIDEGIQVFGNVEKGLQTDTYEIFLVKKEEKRKVIISFEDIINAQTNSTDLEDRLRSVWETEPLK